MSEELNIPDSILVREKIDELFNEGNIEFRNEKLFEILGHFTENNEPLGTAIENLGKNKVVSMIEDHRNHLAEEQSQPFFDNQGAKLQMIDDLLDTPEFETHQTFAEDDICAIHRELWDTKLLFDSPDDEFIMKNVREKGIDSKLINHTDDSIELSAMSLMSAVAGAEDEAAKRAIYTWLISQVDKDKVDKYLNEVKKYSYRKSREERKDGKIVIEPLSEEELQILEEKGLEELEYSIRKKRLDVLAEKELTPNDIHLAKELHEMDNALEKQGKIAKGKIKPRPPKRTTDQETLE